MVLNFTVPDTVMGTVRSDTLGCCSVHVAVSVAVPIHVTIFTSCGLDEKIKIFSHEIMWCTGRVEFRESGDVAIRDKNGTAGNGERVVNGVIDNNRTTDD